MSNEPGTLAGLIADLEELHTPDGLLCCENCDPDGNHDVDWPCPTMHLVQKHKRARYVMAPALHARRKRENLSPGACSVYTGEPPGLQDYAKGCNCDH